MRVPGRNRDTLWDRKGHLLRHVVCYFHQFEIETAEQVAISKRVNKQEDLTSLERFVEIHEAKAELQVCRLCLYNYSRVMLIESGEKRQIWYTKFEVLDKMSNLSSLVLDISG